MTQDALNYLNGNLSSKTVENAGRVTSQIFLVRNDVQIGDNVV